MIIVRAYIVMGELQLTANTTLGATFIEYGGIIDPLLHADCYQISEDTTPIDLSAALSQMIDHIEKESQGHLWDHLYG